MKECITCFNKFIVTQDRQFFCSHICQAKNAIKKANLKKIPKNKTGQFLSCSHCKTQYYVQLYRLKNGNSKYCSRSCLAKCHLKKYIEIHGFKKLYRPKRIYKYIIVSGKRVREHRWIIENKMGRKLEKWEHVHHINGNGLDNRIENLQLLSNLDHQKAEWEIKSHLLSGVL